MRKARNGTLFALLVVGITVATALAACGSNGGSGTGAGPGDGSTGDHSVGSSGSGNDGAGSSGFGDGSNGSGSGSGGPSDASFIADTSTNYPCDGCSSFPGPGAPACQPSTLGPPTLVYPLDGVLLPPNMNVLEVQFVPPQGATLYEVDFENAVTDVRVETTCNAITTVRGVSGVGCGLTLSQPEWNNIANLNANGDPVHVIVRATIAGQSCVTESQQSISINFAKENLSGGIYYWQSALSDTGDGGAQAGQAGGIYYHDFGTFDPTPTPFWTAGSTGRCIGCHTLSKDGVRMSLMNDDADADDEFSDVSTLTMDVASRTVLGGKNVSPGFQTFTHDHLYMIASTFKNAPGGPGPGPGPGPGGGQPDESFAVWSGDGATLVKTNALPSNMQGTQPNLSQDDKTVVFVSPTFQSISTAGDHHFMGGSLWQAAFDESTSTMSNYQVFLQSTGQENFYYPDQSPDGNWVLFNENDDTSAGNDDGDCFYSRKARVKILHFPPQAGDQPIDLPNLNVADGLSNSWPRWSPVVQTYKNHQILWVTFSSNRDYGLRLKNTVNGYPQGSPLDAGNVNMSYDNFYPPESPAYDAPQPPDRQNVHFDDYAAPQIWMAAIIVDPDRSLDSQDRSFPAFWLPFQEVNSHNHSAQWVQTVQSGPPQGDGGTADGGGSSSGGDSGGSCGEQGGACGSGGGTCCADVVCCQSQCQYTCSQ